jgi:hypothetical protein
MRKTGALIRDMADTLDSYETIGSREKRLQQITELASAYDSRSDLLELSRGIDVPQYLMTEKDLPRGKRYLVVARVNYTDAKTGKQHQKFASFYTNEMGSLNELEEQFAAYVRDKDQYEQYQVIGMDFEEIQHNRGLSY